MKNKSFILLHFALLIYAGTTFFSKLASLQDGINLTYLLFVGGQVFCLGVYAILWQMVLKNTPLTIAYANKGIVLIYGALIGLFFFNEKITLTNIVGMLVIIIGIIIMAKGEAHE